MKKIFAFILLLTLLGCSAPTPSANDVETAIAQTQDAQPTNTKLPTNTSTLEPTLTPLATDTNTPAPTNTPRPTNTTKPSPTLTPTVGIDKSRAVAKNYIVSQDSGGVIIEIVRILVADKTAIPQEFSDPIFEDKPVVVEIIFKVINNTDKIVNVYVDQGAVAINGEPIDLLDYRLAGSFFGDDLGGEFLPGVTAIGGVWMGVERTSWDEINKIVISIGRPVDNDFNSLGSDFYFNIDIVDWIFEDLPDELR